MLKPNKLKKGDRVAIVSLSSGILGEEFASHQINLGIKRLNELGLTPVFMNNALKGVDFIKNNPKARAQDLKDSFLDNDIKAIICAIGGDDTYKTIPYLLDDFEFLTKVKNNPKIFLGFSDTTNNHFMLNKLGLVTFYGLNFMSDIAELDDEMLPYTKKSFERLFRNDEEFVIESSPVWYENRNDFSKKALGTKNPAHEEKTGHETLRGSGILEGVLFGGCLDSIYDMYTSNRYDDQKAIYEKYNLYPSESVLKDTILFLETSEEKPTPDNFKIMIETLIKNNVLNNVKALLFAKPYDEVYLNEYREILIELTKDFNLPIIHNMNFGHSIPRALIPYGIKASINLDNSEVKITEKMFID